ncbi:MAG: hypothetical protein U9R08_02485 [Nanoarchaeota archaeon]|nr:hypothetical protein [Nanoarchaeota archaeon]
MAKQKSKSSKKKSKIKSKSKTKSQKKRILKKKSIKKASKRTIKKKATKNKTVKKKIAKKRSIKKVNKTGTVSRKKKTNPRTLKTFSRKKELVFKRRPLPSSFMVVGMFGLIVTSVYTISARLSLTWGFTFIVFFLIIFLASLLSLEPNKK